MAEKTVKTVYDIPLGEKLMHIQTELKAPKNLYNSFGKYKYRNAEGIQEALKPLLKLYGVNCVISDSMVEIGGRVYVKSTVILTDCYTKESIASTAYAREAETKKGMDEAQVTGATSSYARKYALNGLFLLDDTKDVDTEEYQSQKKATQKAEPKKAEVDAPYEVAEETNRDRFRNFCNLNKIDKATIGNIIKKFGLKDDSTDELWGEALMDLMFGGNQ
jgi:hypothetical protein